jgi:putative hydrolase of the HAD superfamily
MTYAGILFDLDGVVRRWPEGISDSIEEQFGLPAGAMAGAAFEPELLRRALTGEIEDAAWREAFERSLQERHGVTGAGIAWNEHAGIGELDRDVIRLVDRLRATMRVGLLSNATTRLEQDLDALGITDRFHVVCNSARMGMAKPDEAIFVRAAGLLDVEPARCIFVDDTPANIEGAERAGMTAIHFTGIDALKRRLTEMNVLPAPARDVSITFRPIREDDIPSLRDWRNSPYVQVWWREELTLESAQAKYLPRIRGEEATRCYIVEIDGVGIGLIQTYRIGDYPEYAEHLPVTPDAWGIDIFIGREDYLHRGLGAPVLQTFMREVLFPQGVDVITIDPEVGNTIAIRAYEKAGFRHLVTKQLPDEPAPTYLMTLRREDFSSD